MERLRVLTLIFPHYALAGAFQEIPLSQHNIFVGFGCG